MPNYSDSPYYVPALQAANTYGVPGNIFAALIGSESSFSPTPGPGGSPYNSGNPRFGGGIAQFIPSTAANVPGYGPVDRLDPNASLNAGAAYLRTLYDKLGSWTAAVGAYKGTGQQYGGSVAPGSDLANALANPDTSGSITLPEQTVAAGGTPSSTSSGKSSGFLNTLSSLAGRAGLLLLALIFLVGSLYLFGARTQIVESLQSGKA